jgi:hypothetical protein
VSQFTQQSTGGTLTFGFPVGNGFTRAFTNYSYEQVRVTRSTRRSPIRWCSRETRTCAIRLLIGAGGNV